MKQEVQTDWVVIDKPIWRDLAEYAGGVVVFIVFRGWVMSLFWAWFAVPLTGWRAISWVEGIRLVLLLSMIPGSGDSSMDQSNWFLRLGAKWAFVLFWGLVVHLALSTLGL